jgi:poly(A) polymerase
MKLSVRKLLRNDDLALIAELAAKRRVAVYFVGGGLRDVLLGRKVKDFDFALSGGAEELPVEFAQAVGGSFFWLDRQRCQARVVRKNDHGTVVFDFAPLRGNEIRDDLLLRDFTINALALLLGNGTESVVDPLRGETDLHRKLIRACSEASFDDDPLRLLRALRFAATLGFAIEPGTWRQLSAKAQLLQAVAPERIRDELFQILTASGVGASLAKLAEAGLLAEIFPAGLFAEDSDQSCSMVSIGTRIESAASVEQVAAGSLSTEIASELHLYLFREVESQVSQISLLKLAAFLGETEQPELLTAPLAERLRLGGKAGRILGLLCGCSERLFARLGRNPTRRAMYRYFADREPAGMALLLLGSARGYLSGELAVDLAEFYFWEFPSISDDLLLTGNEIMAILGIGPGCRVGETVERMKGAESAGLVNNKEEARAFLEKNLLTTKEPVL